MTARIPLHEHRDRNDGGPIASSTIVAAVGDPAAASVTSHAALSGVTTDQHHAKLHATTHQPSGADAMAVDAAQGTGSLRTITTSAAQAIGTAAAGAGTAAASSNHVHATGAGTPTTQALGDAAATGTGPAAAMTDHKHAMPSATVGSSGLTMATARLLGRTTAGTGSIETITVGTGLSLSAGALTATGGGSVATDTIWDAAGDLAVGTGADTAAKLAITVPAANILNVVGVVNGETTWSVKAVHDATAPVTQAFGDTATAGTALTAAHRDHKHGMPAYPTLTTVDGQLGADVAASAGAFVDVVSITLSTGTWDVYGWLQVLTTSNGPQYLYATITDSAGTTQYAKVLAIITTNSAYNVASLLAPALVISGSTVIKLRGQTDGSANFKGSTSLGAGGGTKLHAMRIA